MRHITVGIGEVGLQLERRRVLGDGIRYISAILVNRRQITVRVRERRIDLYTCRLTD